MKIWDTSKTLDQNLRLFKDLKPVFKFNTFEDFLRPRRNPALKEINFSRLGEYTYQI